MKSEISLDTVSNLNSTNFDTIRMQSNPSLLLICDAQPNAHNTTVSRRTCDSLYVGNAELQPVA